LENDVQLMGAAAVASPKRRAKRAEAKPLWRVAKEAPFPERRVRGWAMEKLCGRGA